MAFVLSIIIFGTSLVVKSMYQQLTYSDLKSTCKIAYEAVAKYHNKEDKIKLYTYDQENLKRFADKIGLAKPKPRGPWKFKSGRLYKRYFKRMKKRLKL